MKEIITQFAQEASFLWFQRDGFLNEPHVSLQGLADKDERLEAHIDGLRVAGGEAWEICKESFGNDDAEGLFAPAVLAFESNDANRILDVIEAVNEDHKKARVLISALGWLPFEQVALQIAKLLADESSYLRYIGIAASAIHRHDSGPHLDKAAMDNFPLLAARALRAYGELGTNIRINPFTLQEKLSDEVDSIRFSTAWSAAMSGNQEAIEVLKKFVTPDSPYNEKSLNMAMRRMNLSAQVDWQKELAASSDTVRLAVIGAGISGDSALIPWLIDRMKTPELVRVAGEAFTMITGIDSELEEMNGERPDELEVGPNDDPQDNNVAMDTDGNLPWPNVELLAVWWNKNQGNFPRGTRYLLGKPVSVEHLRHVLQTGLQRQRAAAALELAILQSGSPLFNIKAPGFRQIKKVVGV